MEANPYRDLAQDAGVRRSVPLGVRLRLLLGGFTNMFGWIFFGFGMVFVWLFCIYPLAGLMEFNESGHGTAASEPRVVKVEGRVEGVEGTKVRVAFEDEQGQSRTVLGSIAGEQPKSGEAAMVAFPAGLPEAAKVIGPDEKVTLADFAASPAAVTSGPAPEAAPAAARNSETPPWPVMAMVWLFPLIGLCFILSGLRKGVRGIGLLRSGAAAEGMFLGCERTSTRVNNRMVYKYLFEFTAGDGRSYRAVARTHEEENFGAVLAGRSASDCPVAGPRPGGAEQAAGPHMPLLYDPRDPSRAVLLADLPGLPSIENGRVTIDDSAMTLVTMIAPLVSVALHAAFLWYLLTHI